MRRSMQFLEHHNNTTLTPRQGSFATMSGLKRVIMKSRSGSNSAANRYHNSNCDADSKSVGGSTEKADSINYF